MILAYFYFCKSLRIENEIKEIEAMSKNVLEVHSLYFSQGIRLSVTLLQSKKDKNDNLLITQLTRDVSFYRKDATIKVRNYSVSNKKIKDTVSYKYNYSSIYRHRQRVVSSFYYDDHIIIAREGYILNQFLHENSRNVIPNNRANYLFLLTYKKPSHCFTDIQSLMRLLWEKFQVSNMVFLTYNNRKNYVHIYLPFEQSFQSLTLSEFRSQKFTNKPITKLNGHVLKISMFVRNPTAVRTNESKAFSGVDGNLLVELSKTMNFTADISHSPDHFFYGQTLPNGSATGALGAVINRDVDLATNGRFIVAQVYDCVEFTVPYDNDKICVIAPKSEEIPHWAEIFHSFKRKVLMLFLVVIGLSVLIWYKLSKTGNRAWIEIFSIFINVPVKMVLTPQRKIFLTFLLQFLVIINGVFQGNLIKSFSAVSYYPDINTLEELDRSGLKILTSLGVFNNNESDLFKSLQSKVIDINASAIERVAYWKNIMALERKNDANLFKSVYVSSDGTPLIHVVPECPISYHLGFIVNEGSPYLPRLNQLIRRMFESGLTKKWYSDISQKIIIKRRFNKHDVKENRRVSFSLYDMQLVFLTLILGLTSSFIVFVCERIFYWQVCTKLSNKM